MAKKDTQHHFSSAEKIYERRESNPHTNESDLKSGAWINKEE